MFSLTENLEIKTLRKNLIFQKMALINLIVRKKPEAALCSQNVLFLLKFKGVLLLKKRQEKVAYCRKKHKGGSFGLPSPLIPLHFCKHIIFLVKCETPTHVLLLLRLQKIGLTSEPTDSRSYKLQRNF